MDMRTTGLLWKALAATGAALAAPWVVAAPAAAHAGDHALGQNPWLAWSWDPWVVVPTLLAGVLYVTGVSRLWRNAGIGAGVRRWQAVTFGIGWIVLALALTSPADVLGESLFWVHMVQHELLILVAAPLLVLSAPQTAFLWALPQGWRRTLGGATRLDWWRAGWHGLSNPLSAWSIHAVLLWGWHAPPLFAASLTSDGVHTLQHISFFGSALLFWLAVLRSGTGPWGRGVAAVAVFTTAVHSSALGALLTFSPEVWYPAYHATAPAWGLTALEDQQLGGLIMWVPGGVVFLIAGLVLIALWLREADHRVRRHERRSFPQGREDVGPPPRAS